MNALLGTQNCPEIARVSGIGIRHEAYCNLDKGTFIITSATDKHYNEWELSPEEALDMWSWITDEPLFEYAN